MSLNACVISHSDTSNYKFLPEVAEFKAESRLEFPMVMVETAMAIEAYQEMSAQEKVQMGYIYKSAVSTGEGRYKMDRFYEYSLDMNGKSISQPDAEWIIKTEAGSFDRYFTQTTMRLTRPDTPEHEYRLVCDYKGYPSYEILFSSLAEEDGSYYSWIIEMSCSFTTDDGYVVTINTLEPITRKVYRAVPDVSPCSVEMKGTLQIRFEGDRNGDGQLEELDVVKYVYDGNRRNNEIYQF